MSASVQPHHHHHAHSHGTSHHCCDHEEADKPDHTQSHVETERPIGCFLKMERLPTTSKYETMMSLARVVCGIALTAFAAYTSWSSFAPAFAFGVALGLYSHFTNSKGKGCQDPHGACTQGFIEWAFNVKLPAPVSLAADMALTIEHIDHHPVMVPIVACYFGKKFGEMMGQAGSLAAHQISVLSDRLTRSMRSSSRESRPLHA